MCDELASGGIARARIIATPQTYHDLRVVDADGRGLEVEISCQEAPPPGLRRAVLAEVEAALADGPVLLHPGDSLFRHQVAAMSERFSAGDVDTVLPAQASVAPVSVETQRRASDTLLALGPNTRPLIGELLSPSNEGEDLLTSLLHSTCRLAVCEESEHWAYSDSTEGLLAANRMMLDALPESSLEGIGENNRVRGRVSVSPSAFLSNCVLHGPVSIADGVVLEDSFIGPYTAVGPAAIISGAEIENSMVLTAAEIRHPGSRIEGSIIGEQARVTRAFELPSGLHLRLGPGSRITLS